jgi:hypothetical protein
MSELTYSGEVFAPSENATRDELTDAIEEAIGFLADAREVESTARSCARGWEEHIEALQDRLAIADEVYAEVTQQ